MVNTGQTAELGSERDGGNHEDDSGSVSPFRHPIEYTHSALQLDSKTNGHLTPSEIREQHARQPLSDGPPHEYNLANGKRESEHPHLRGEGFAEYVRRALDPHSGQTATGKESSGSEGQRSSERPSLSRHGESDHINHVMPSSALKKDKFDGVKVEDLEQEQRDEYAAEQNRAKGAEIAANVIRNDRGEQNADGGVFMANWKEGTATNQDGMESRSVTSEDGQASPKAQDTHSNRNSEAANSSRGKDSSQLTKAQAQQRRALDEVPGKVVPQTDKQGEQSPEGLEKVMPREERPGENGNVPEALAATKQEDPPGPRTQVNVKPRIPEMHYHTIPADDRRQDKERIPLHIAADGETENLPNGNVYRHGPDQDDQLTRTRTQEEEDLANQPGPENHKTLDSDYMLERQRNEAAPHDDSVPKVIHELPLKEGTESPNNSISASNEDRVPSRQASDAQKIKQTPRIDDFGPQNEPRSTGSSRKDRLLNRQLWSTLRRDRVSSRNQSSVNLPPAKDGQFSSALQLDQPIENPQSSGETIGQKKWAILRQKVLGKNASVKPGEASTIIPITTELLAGQLPVMIIKNWLDRDEHGRRAVPVLLGSLKFRIGDSAGIGTSENESSSGREVFRIECEYGDGAVKWVIYRELRDFLSLHAHYKAENLGTRVSHFRGTRQVEIPEFPRSSIPYLGRVGIRGHSKSDDEKDGPGDNQNENHGRVKLSKQEQSRQSRQALQQYLVGLIRAVIFKPESTRLCRFFELSSLTVALGPRGGFQSKAGFLRVIGSNASKRANQPGISPLTWKKYRSPKWWIVRESYLVATDEPESTDLFEVFLIDGDFVIERPRRLLRQGLAKLTGKGSVPKLIGAEDEKGGSGTAQADRQRAIAAAAGSGHRLDKNDKASGKHEAALADGDGKDASQHTFFVSNSQMKLQLVAKNVRQMQQFIVAIERVAKRCIWRSRNRFDSFAPIRMNVAAQWQVDGRDYLWNLSRALNMAKDKIYIHDWWLSPELYLRRPPNERYRLDNILKRKAEEGVKVFVILYNEVSDRTTPVESLYAKKRLSSLHPNIMVQRSPSHFQTGTFYWSHHEKMVVIDEAIAFMGGIDLCFGRWDTPQHVLVDDAHDPKATGEDGPIWPGKDLCNDRVTDPFALNKPFEDMFDRSKVPRMPWHDVGLQMVGQPARDLCRHFVQRWNHLIRNKNHKRPMPFLLPPTDYREDELQHLRLKGTCEVQICRSCGPWSMGTSTKVEHSIQNAYCKSIQLSEHFVYIENQFFITSTVVDGVEIENRIGDALVDRIIRAHKEGTPWRACIVIPLLPGYAFPIDISEASSVRLIMECQNRTICRGEQSIFSRLRREGINPNDYITFFSLRGWGKFKNGSLTTEQVYIHGKVSFCVGLQTSMNAPRGEIAIPSCSPSFAIRTCSIGKPYKVGRYAHTLRIRLMREHVGVDVDAIVEDQLMTRDPVAPADDLQKWDPDHEQVEGEDPNPGVTTIKRRHARDRLMMTVGSGISGLTKGVSENTMNRLGKAANVVIKPLAIVKDRNTIAGSGSGDDDAERHDAVDGQEVDGFASSVVPTIEEKTIFERRPSAKHADGKPLFDVIDEDPSEAERVSEVPEATVPESELEEYSDKPVNKQQSGGSSSAPKINGTSKTSRKFGAPANAVEDDHNTPDQGPNQKESTEEEKLAVKARSTLRKHLSAQWTMPTPTPKIDPNAFQDPLCEEFWKDMWTAVAVHNPDDLVTSWASYKAFVNHAEKHNRAPADVAQEGHEPVKTVHGGPDTHGAGGGGSGGGLVESQPGPNEARSSRNVSDIRDSDVGKDGSTKPTGQKSGSEANENSSTPPASSKDNKASVVPDDLSNSAGAGAANPNPNQSEVTRVASGPEDPWHEWEKEEMEKLLGELRGHLVVYPTRFLEAEDLANNFLFNSDKILPMPIYD